MSSLLWYLRNSKALIFTKTFKERLISGELLSNGLLKTLIYITILFNAIGLFLPVLGSNDSYFYSVIAKHIVMNDDWVNLTFAGTDWLDKPHFPFWITAVSYEIFGVNTFAYVLPGFLFNLLGAFYTYRLGKHLYSNQVGLLSSILYLSSIHILLSSIDVRAEAFLLGEIMPACYYWYLYNETSGLRITNNEDTCHFTDLIWLKNTKALLFGSIFTAMAVMTKGVFVLLLIFSGIFVFNFYNQRAKEFFTKKWLMAFLFSFIFILPELISLFLQFDLHPEKIVFGHNDVSGLKFFFWDSQFGRFFETGPITIGQQHGFSHYFFFMHTFLWAFLPWTVFFIAAIVYAIKKSSYNNDAPNKIEQNSKSLYLWFSFIPTFILFSLTKFQLDHYTNILIPFAAILSAEWICNRATRLKKPTVFYIQTTLALILVIATSALSLLLFNGLLFIVSAVLCAVVLLLIVILSKNRHLNKAIVSPLMAVLLVFVLVMFINGRVYPKYDVGLNIASYLQDKSSYPVVDYDLGSSSLEFHLIANRYNRIDNLKQLNNYPKPYYLVMSDNDYTKMHSQIMNATVLQQFIWIPQEKFIPTLFNINLRKKNSQQIDLILVR